MKSVGKIALLLFGVTAFVIPEIEIINVPIIGRKVEFTAKVSAQTAQVYIAPDGPSRKSRTTGTGSRGCDRAGDTNLQLLVPDDHLPVTVSARPTFFWYVSDTTLPVRFTLVEPGVAKPLADRSFNVKRSGVVQLELPSDVPGLTLGKEYRWTVSLVCNKERPSENIYADSSIKRIAITPKLAQTLAGAGQDPQKRSLVYGRSGIWYDALNNSYISYQANPHGKVTSWYFSQLLSQVGMPIVNGQPLQQLSNIHNQ